ncbi:hypothetical protein ABB37_09267 [Leptomonas pyrrhocoris]|uniref:Proteasome activator complex subunit 4 C-terminal domain-containing protein n=1 Tax=Leptomonas pyrrhocoris TaxID=157538 RepID=A0A0N0DR78_LEPPY|nr:hypothetical protein ABB37_09267 [Leptomonas pyrrhocoris]XP_015652701.1 hypothetical protein ABB37_09267 [Leptomonas pyrrhocoris]KPA74261.1 hypothetical protein ABB37_09267 [Leptomonas pyrrhocoris]KPA74262.1 hypothetical protein ABB37_09267 [Leptomonas pyrrhocoris]|eukprot:XP_015652700.1 hypothetical protein ABB37_09267 [Leptomonas pyrrhocoris]
MSSASSHSSELSRFFSSSTSCDTTVAELCGGGGSVIAEPNSKAGWRTASLCLSDSNGQSQSGRLDAEPLPTTTTNDDARLLPKERIHHYIDQCVPPDLIAHQRATDGRVVVQLCEELLQFGGPAAWAGRLPSNIFSGSVHDAPGDVASSDGEARAVGELPACIAAAALYCSDDVPATWDEDVRCKVADDAALPTDTVPWGSLTRHLHQLVVRLNQLITREGTHFPCYTLPFRLQARVTPVLYGWATCWPLAEANVRCWECVVKAFHAACGAHQPPRDELPSSAVEVPPPRSSPSPLLEEAPPDGGDTRVRCAFTLPWKPLAALFLAVLEPANSRLPSWVAMVSAVRRELPALCRRASPFFPAEAVDGLWGLICSDLQRASGGVAALSLFVQLVPYRHLCTASAAPPHRSGRDEARAEEEEGSREDGEEAVTGGAPRLTDRAQQILRFLLVEAAAWSPPTPPNPPVAAGPKRQQRRRQRKPRCLLMPWRTAVVFFASSLARAHPSVAGLGDYAEPLFTAWLTALALPIGSPAGMTGATAAAAVSRVVRRPDAAAAAAAGVFAAAVGGGGGGGGGSGQRGAAEVRPGKVEWTAAPYARLLSAFPDNAESPLWRQLERWIRATGVLVRPGLPCTPGSATQRVCECYCLLAREALRRVPKGHFQEERRSDRRQDSTRSDFSAATSVNAEVTSSTGPPPRSGRFWSPPTIDKFVQLFLPLAVAAFQTRAPSSTGFLISLLYMSPAIALPALLTCVDAGLNSPTEVSEQRRTSGVLLMHAIVTLFTEDERLASEVGQAARETVAEYTQGCVSLLLSLVSPSTPEIASSVLTLLGVAVSYIPTQMLMQSSYEAEAFGTEYASRVIPLFTERGAERGRASTPTHQNQIEAFLYALPPSAEAMVTSAVLREAHNRDHGNRMSALVRMVAVVAPAETWRCAEKTWLPVLHDLSANDAEVEWAGALLAACVSGLGERVLVRAHAADIIKAVHVQLRFLTSKTRRGVAVQLTHALVASLMRPCWTAASCFTAPKWRRGAGNTEAVIPSEDRTPLSPPMRATSRAAMRNGTATAARVRVEWPDADEDVRLAATFFNDALRDLVQIVSNAQNIRVGSPDAAAALDASSLSRRFLLCADANNVAATPSPRKELRGVCESASVVNPHSVVEGALEWMVRLLEIFEWIYVEPSPSVARTAAVDAVVAAARRGVCWADLNPRSAWRAVRLPADCRPALSRAALFEVVYTHLCLPLMDHHVLTPLSKAGVELRPLFLALHPSLDTTVPAAAQEGSSAGVWKEDSVVDWNCVRGLLRWLVLSQIDCPQQFWLPRSSFYWFWSKVSAHSPSCRSRKKLPLSGWASRSLQLHVEASVAGYLPVSQETLSRTVSVLQCMSFSPHERVRASSLHLLLDDQLIGSLNAASLVLLVRRQDALLAAVLTQWMSLRDEREALAAEAGKSSDVTTLPPRTVAAEMGRVSASPPPSSAAALPSALLRALQESTSGTLQLFAAMTLQSLFTKAPWWGLRAWRVLVTFPEELRTMSTAQLLPLIQKSSNSLLQVGTTTSRSAPYMEVLLQLAGRLVAAHPTRTVVLLTVANRLYWPSPQRWVSLHAVRLLARLAESVHVEVRSGATKLLSAMAVHVAVREVRVPVYLLGSTQPDELGQTPSSFLLSAGGVDALGEEEKQTHHAAVCAVQASLQKLKDVLPMLLQYVRDKGQAFPLCVITVPKSAAVAAGLPLLSSAALTAPHGSFVDSPSFVNALAGELPPNTPAYRAGWSELLFGAATRPAGTHDTPATSSSPAPSASPPSWALRVLTLPVERPVAGAAPEALAFSVVNLLTSAHDGSAAATQRVADLLTWAEEQLQRWVDAQHTAHDHHAPKTGAWPSTEEATEGYSAAVQRKSDAGRAPARPGSVEEDEMYRLFLSVLDVASAVVQLTSQTAPAVQAEPHAAAALSALRTRALRLFLATLKCLCSHAAVPHAIMQSMMILGISAVGGFISVEEAWCLIEGVSQHLRSTPVEAATAVGDPKATSARAVALQKAPENGGSDTWSQRQLRRIRVVFTLVKAVPLIVASALLPRLAALVGEHEGAYFVSPADQVRQCAAQVVARLITMGYLHSEALVEYNQCYPAARQLLSLLLDKVNAQVFQGKLSFTSPLQGRGAAAEEAEARPALSSAPAPLPLPSPSTEDLALLSTMALTLQAIPIDTYVDFVDDIVMLLCRCLDLSFTKMQHLHAAAEAALQSLAVSWLPKAHAHRLLEHLCAICVGAVPYGASRRSKTACTRALRFVVFRNLHRIGKYAMILRVGDAALASLAHPSAAVRNEGSQLFAILTKVASEAQTRVVVQAIASECRQLTQKAVTMTPTQPPTPPPPHVQSAPAQLSDVSSGPSSPETEGTPMSLSRSNDPSHNRRIAVVQALGAVVLADPGTPSPYVPKLMQVLASCAREGNTECGRFAKRIFEQWWHAHREGWEQEYRKYFTAEQVDSMTDLLFAPRYYA